MRLVNITVLAIGLILVGIWSATFIVDERQKAIKLRLGKIEASDYEPGLHFKMPLINNIKIFDDRIQMLDERADKYLTKEKKNVLVDSFVKWKINDVSKFFVTMQGDYSRANVRISQIVRDGLRSAFGKRTEKEAISGERSEIMQTITVHTIEQVKDFGIEVVDLRIKRVDLPPEISRSVFQRMDSERDRAAKELRSKGAEEAEKIRAEADRKRTVMLAKAIKLSEEIRGQGDSKATEIYANAYGQNSEFYSFYRSLEAYRNSFDGTNNLMMLSPDSEYFEYFSKNKAK